MHVLLSCHLIHTLLGADLYTLRILIRVLLGADPNTLRIPIHVLLGADLNTLRIPIHALLGADLNTLRIPIHVLLGADVNRLRTLRAEIIAAPRLISVGLIQIGLGRTQRKRNLSGQNRYRLIEPEKWSRLCAFVFCYSNLCGRSMR